MNGNGRGFLIVFGAAFVLVLLFGVAAFLLTLVTESSEDTTRLLISTWRGMFTGLLGLGSGYVIGRAANGRTDGHRSE